MCEGPWSRTQGLRLTDEPGWGSPLILDALANRPTVCEDRMGL